MPPRDDSDSSGDEDQDYTETNVLLGFASADSNGEKVSRLGGSPEWLDPTTPPSSSLARCRVCHDFMVLLLQLNAELPERFPGHERRLYVLSCRRRSCRRREGSVRALRGLRVSKDAASAAAAAAAAVEEKDSNRRAEEEKRAEEAKKTAPKQRLGDMLFGVAKPSVAGSEGNPLSKISATAAAPPPSPPSSAGQGGIATSLSGTTDPPVSKSPSDSPEGAKAETATAADELPKTFAEALSLNNNTSAPAAPAAPATPQKDPEPWPTDRSALPVPYPVRWLSEVEYETLDGEPSPLPANIIVAALESEQQPGGDGGSTSGKGKEDKDVFESAMDSAFQRFADRVGQNPEQSVRYEFGGAPLLYSRDDAVARLLLLHRRDRDNHHHHHGADNSNKKVATVSVAEVLASSADGPSGMPRCGNCGAARVFEVQLMPHAIEELESGEGADGAAAATAAAAALEGMDWGTIIVGVCERDCTERGKGDGDTGHLEEWVGVQWEEELTMRM